MLAVLALVASAVLYGSPAKAEFGPRNAGFEGGGARSGVAGWTTYSEDDHPDAAAISKGGHTGRFSLMHRADEAYHVETQQVLTELPDARYTAALWVRSGGDHAAAYIAFRGCGTAEARTPLPVTDTWQEISVSVLVTTGRCMLTLVSRARAGGWAQFDDVSLSAVDGGTFFRARPPSPAVRQQATDADAVPLPSSVWSAVAGGALLLAAGALALWWRARRSLVTPADLLERGEQRQRQIVADVAHELRSPLTTVRSHLEALMDGVLPADPEVFASLHEEALLQQRIVDDLQDLALAETGNLTYQCSPVNIGDLLRSCVTSCAMRADAAGVRLAVGEIADGEVFADPGRLRQVIGNLVGNALRHTPPGGQVILGCDVEAGTRAAGKSVVVMVTDTGCGIAADDLPHVFERFWRADAARGRVAGGSGLGLAIARQIIADHGGTISVQSRLGAGTTFTVRLPRAAALPAGRHRLPGRSLSSAAARPASPGLQIR